RQSVDVGHDRARHWAERMRHARQHEGILHVDHKERGLARIEIVVDERAAASGYHALHDRLRDCDLVHGCLRPSQPRPDVSSMMRTPVMAARTNTIHRSSSALRYLPNRSYQAMAKPSYQGE